MTRRRWRATVTAAMLALTVLPARAGWKEEVGTLRIGMLARPGAGAAVPGASAIKRAYSAALGIPVDIFVARDFAALAEAQAARRIDYAIYSATAYAAAWRLCGCIEPLVAPIAHDGSTGLRAVLLLRPDANRSDGAALRIAAAGGSATADWLARVATTEGDGTRLAGAEIVTTASASEAERLFVEGEAAGLYGWAPARVGGSDGGTAERLAAAGLDAGAYEVAWTSAPLRYGPHAVRSDLPQELKDALARFLTGLKLADPELYDLVEEERQGGFLRVSQRDYEAAVGIVDALRGEDGR